MSEPLVLLPGLQSDHRSWVYQTEYFAGRRPVLVPVGQQFRPTIADMADCVLEQLPDRFHLAAWSMGGYIALQMLPQIRERLASLILVSTSARPEDKASTMRRMELIELAEREGMAVSNKRSMAHSCLDIGALDLSIRESVQRSAVELGIEAYRGQQRAIIDRADARPGLTAVDCPTFIMVGAHDAVTPPECSWEMHNAIAGSRLEIIPNSGHCAPLEQPALFNEILDWWLKSVEKQAGAPAWKTSSPVPRYR